MHQRTRVVSPASRSLLAGVCALIALLSVMGAAAGTEIRAVPGTESRAAKPVLRIGTPHVSSSPDPARDVNGPGIYILRALAYEPILRMKPDGSFRPGLATSWRYFRTGGGPNKGFEFTLRANARFSDGTRVTAKAVKAWLDYFAQAGGPNAVALGSKPRVETVGKWTVRLRLQTPNPLIPWALSGMRNWAFVASQRAAAKPSLFANSSYGAGQYMLDPSRTVDGDHYTFVPNPYYWDKSAIRYSRVEVKLISSPSSMLQALQAGQLDVAIGDISTLAEAEARGFKVIRAVALQNRLLLANRGAKPLADLRVRQALNYAIDRTRIVRALTGKYGLPTSATIASDAFDRKLAGFYPYNPQRAKSLLAAAGYPEGFTLKVLTWKPEEAYLQPAAQYFQAVGVKLDITSTISIPEYVQRLEEAKFDAFVIETNVVPMAQEFLRSFTPGAFLNPFSLSDPVMNKLYYTGIRATQSSSYWKQIGERWVKQAYEVPFAGYPVAHYISKKVGGVATSEARLAMLDPTEWYPK